MKLALEALEDTLSDDPYPYSLESKAITALREALAEPDFWEGYVPEPVKPAQCKYPKCSYPCTDLPDCRDAEQPAQQALDKKAENARELGLDYEPVCNKDPQGCWNVRCQLGKKCKNTPAQQEYASFAEWAHDYVQDNLHKLKPAQRTWVGLTNDEKHQLNDALNLHGRFPIIDAIESKIKEKNT